jgi:hypothetical protein
MLSAGPVLLNGVEPKPAKALMCFPSCTPMARTRDVLTAVRAAFVANVGGWSRPGVRLEYSLQASAANVDEYLSAEHVIGLQLELRGETRGPWSWADEPDRTPEHVVEVLARSIVRAQNNTGEP